MPSTKLYPPSQENNFLSAPDLEKILRQLQKVKGTFLLKIIIGFGVALLFVLLASLRQEPEYLVGQFGLIKGLMIAIFVMAIPILSAHFSHLRNLKKDLKERSKVSHQTAVEIKERSLLKNKIYARIDSERSGYQEFEIETAVFHKLVLGQKIRLEFTPNAKCVLNIEVQD